ncbi:MAG: AbgT family transporter [Candidatus Eisenbacteria sp.]|nr:AbgT family transporter [Candidatus Eisenbacteria bacterium]
MTKDENTTPKRNLISGFLSTVERAGNALPHPATLFALFALGIIVLSRVFAELGLSAVNPRDGALIQPVSLLSRDGLHWILEHLIVNFTGFAPLGTVLVAMLGIGVAESSGLIATSLRLLVHAAPRRLLTFVIVLSGVMSNMASDVGYVLLLPLGAIIFLSVGRHPIAGLAAAFAGVSGGFSANLLLGTIDPLLAGLTQEAAQIVDPGYRITPACNYYFMFVSTFMIAGAGTWVTEKVVVPRLGEYEHKGAEAELQGLTGAEKRGLVSALLISIVLAVVLLMGLVPANGFLRNAETGSVLHSPFMHGIVGVIFIGGLLAGLAYGLAAGTFRNDADVVKGMRLSMETMSLFMVLVFFAAQFVAFFKYSNLGLVLAIKGAEVLKASGLGAIPLMLSFIVMSATINLLMGSASAKWAFVAPVFVPMFMFLGYTPELVQGAYRIGDSASNIISPMMSFFALIVAFVQKYDPKAGIGTVIATMLPYSVVFMVAWMLLLTVWMLLGLPLGPGAGLYLAQ